MADTFPCPQCGILLHRSSALAPESLFECPKCTHEFRVPDTEVVALPSLELDETPAPPIRRAEPPQVADLFAFEDRAAVPPRRERAIDEDDDRPRRREFDFEEDEDRPPRRGRLETLPTGLPVGFGASYRLAWSCWGEFVGPTIGFQFVAGLAMIPLAILSIVPCFGPLMYLMAYIILMRGPQLVALRAVWGKYWSFNDFFGGFGYIGPIIGLAFFQGILLFIASIPFIIVMIVTEVMFPNGPTRNEEVIFGAGMLGAGLLGLLLHLYLDARLFTFAFQLMVHQRLGVIEAMRGCWRLSEGRTLSFIGINVLFVLTAISGVLFFFIGQLLTVPLAHLFVASAYARMMGAAKTDEPRSRRDEEDDEDDRPRPRRTTSPSDDY